MKWATARFALANRKSWSTARPPPSGPAKWPGGGALGALQALTNATQVYQARTVRVVGQSITELTDNMQGPLTPRQQQILTLATEAFDSIEDNAGPITDKMQRESLSNKLALLHR